MLLGLLCGVWGGQYREVMILNGTLCVVKVLGGQNREELILKFNVFVVKVWGGNIERN